MQKWPVVSTPHKSCQVTSSSRSCKRAPTTQQLLGPYTCCSSSWNLCRDYLAQCTSTHWWHFDKLITRNISYRSRHENGSSAAQRFDVAPQTWDSKQPRNKLTWTSSKHAVIQAELWTLSICARLCVCVSNGFRTLICFEELNDHAVCHLKHHRRMHLAVIGCLTYDQAKKDVELVSERHLQSHVTCAFSWQVGHTKLLRSTAGAVRETLCALWMYSLAAQCLVKRIKRKATAQVDHKHEIVYVSACKFKQKILSINTSQQRYINNL